MFKNALISVSDKTGLEEFLAPLVKNGLRIVSSGGTAEFLTSKGFAVTKVSDQTQFPEVMGGRVKTLHPSIHMPILQRGSESGDHQVLESYGLKPFDLLIVNLYPFEQALSKNLNEKEMIEFIDIGGPSLLRGAAKNFENITVLCDPKDYSWVAEKKQLSFVDRKKLASRVFKHTAYYDSLIFKYLTKDEPEEVFIEKSTDLITGTLHQPLRYGENPQQNGFWFKTDNEGLHQAELLQGKELSYNNILDIDSALQALRLFEQPTAVSVKHNSPCGVASGEVLSEALERSLKADPVSVFGGIIALNRTLDSSCAKLLSALFLECVVAPSISDEAKSILLQKKNVRVLIWPDFMTTSKELDFRSVSGGYLKQSKDQVLGFKDQWKIVNGPITPEDQKALEFAWRVCAPLKSNAIAITSSQQSLGLGMGQVNRVDAVKQAFERARTFHPEEKNLYLASDAFFPFPDSIELAAQFGVKAIIQPGGSVKDNEVIEKAKQLKIPMILTGQRHFKH